MTIDPGLYEQYAEFLEWIPDAAVASDPDGNLVLANRKATELFDRSREELLGSPCVSFLASRFREQYQREHDQYFAVADFQPAAKEAVTYMLRADGSEFPAEFSRALLGSPGRQVLVSSVRDISTRLGYERDRLEAQEELSQSRRVESLGKLAGGIAHDFNNQLGVIINYADFVASAVEDRPEAFDDVQQIQSAAQRAAELTRQLLVFSRHEGRGRKPVQLNDTLRDLEKLFDRVLGDDITLITRLDPELWNVVVDVGEIEQAAINLALNARDAMPNGGTLVIETKNVFLDEAYAAGSVDGPQPGNYVRVTVADTGIGMDAETVERVFEPFFTTKPAPEGTGLGLATVYGTVRNHGGSIFIYSEVDQGTSVKIHLPASDQPVVAGDDVLAFSAARGNGERLLVVEDEPLVRKMVVRGLSDNGFEVIDCGRAKTAFDLLEDPNEVFDLLLTDVVMPDVHGGELAKRASELRPALPVLFMSGYSDLNLRQLDHPSGELQLLEKPFSVVELISAVREALERSAQSRSETTG